MNKTLIAAILKALDQVEAKPKSTERDALLEQIRRTLKLAIKYELRK